MDSQNKGEKSHMKTDGTFQHYIWLCIEDLATNPKKNVLLLDINPFLLRVTMTPRKGIACDEFHKHRNLS